MLARGALVHACTLHVKSFRGWLNVVCMTQTILYTRKANMLRSILAIVKTFYIFIGTLQGTYLPNIKKKEPEEFRTLWNNHKIRWNMLASCPAGVPDDIHNLVGLERTCILMSKNFMVVIMSHSEFGLSSFHSNGIGVWDHKKLVHPSSLASSMLAHTKTATHFYPLEFQQLADIILGTVFHISQTRITIQHAQQNYVAIESKIGLWEVFTTCKQIHTCI